MNKRRTLSMCMSMAGLLPLMRRLDRKKPSLKILAFHRVKDICESDYLFDENLIDATIKDFDDQMEFISKYYKVLPLSEAYEEFSKTGNPNIVAVTFDDGFDDLYFNVFPIIKKYAIRPTMFLTAGLIGTQRTLWSEEVVFALKSCGRNKINLHSYDPSAFSEDVEVTIGLAKSKLLSLLKSVSEQNRKLLVKKLFEFLELSPEVSSNESRMLTWDMVVEMNKWGVEFGSHSLSHGVLSNLDSSELNYELMESKSLIEKSIGIECKSIAYPVGGLGAYNPKVISAVKTFNYELGCTYLSGVNYKNLEHYELRRLHVDSSVDIGWFKGIVTMPSLCAADFKRD